MMTERQVNNMGYGRRFYCLKCGYNFEEISGVGYMYPMIVEDVKEDGKNGKLGPMVKEFLDRYPDGTLNCEMAGFVCKECGAMKNDYKYTMYKPKEGIKEFPPYCMPDEFRRFYTLYRRYPHKCDECGGDMKMLTVNAKPKCPRCGGMLGVGISSICWD